MGLRELKYADKSADRSRATLSRGPVNCAVCRNRRCRAWRYRILGKVRTWGGMRGSSSAEMSGIQKSVAVKVSPSKS